jgi:hypothetical protein
MYRLSPPQKSLSQRALEREALERQYRRKHMIDFTAAIVTSFVGSVLIIYFACRFIWG